MVEILLATYNGEKYLRKQLDSLLDQTYKDIRIIIRDDNSKDNTVTIVKEYIKKYPEKIFLVSDDIKCGGAAKNFFQLLKYATEDYVMFCDQDDYWKPNKVEITLNAMQKSEKKYGKCIPIIVYTNYQVVDGELEPLEIDYRKLAVYRDDFTFRKLLVQSYVTGCLMMLNKEVYSNVGIYDEDIPMHDWWCALYAGCFGKIVHVPETTMQYRQHGDNVVGAVDVTSFAYTWKRLFKTDTKSTVESYYKQADVFRRRFMPCMEGMENKEILENFLDIPNHCKLVRMYKLVKGRYFKSDWKRILGQLFFA